MKNLQNIDQVINAVANRVGLVYLDYMQDWDIEMAEAKDTTRLIDMYDSFEKPEEKYVLMRLIIAAFDDYLGLCEFENRAPNPDFEIKLIEMLRRDWALHKQSVEYWAHYYHDDGEPVNEVDAFHVSPLMRVLWNRHASKI